MNKLLASFFVLLLSLVPAGAQNVDWPPPAGSIAFLGVFNTVAPTMTNGKAGWAQLDVNGNVKVNIAAGAGSGGTSATDQATFTQGVSGFNPVGCAFSDASTLGAGQQGTVRCTNDRQFKVLDSAVLAAVQAAIPAGTNTIGNVNTVSQYPLSAIPVTVSATGTTLSISATLAASGAGLKTYLCSYSVRANATGATTVSNTIGGVITATLTHMMWIAPAASGLGVDEQIFMPCVPSSAVNTAIVVTTGAPGAGGQISATATGYQAP